MKSYKSIYQHAQFTNASGYADPTAKAAMALAEKPVVYRLAYTAPGYKAKTPSTIVVMTKGGKRHA